MGARARAVRPSPPAEAAPLARIEGAALAASRAAALALPVAAACYLSWRIATLGPATFAGAAVIAVEAITAAFIVWTAMLGRRVCPARVPDPPAGTLDIFVTVCGEPPSVVEPAVRAALAVSYPHRTYLLDDGPHAGRARDADMREVGRRLGVRVLQRRSGPPGKAGNLNAALARTGGELIAVIDADNEAVASLGDALGHFADPSVGFVTSPQVTESGVAGLGGREVLFHRLVQPARDRDGLAVSRGNGTIYRRSALAGGFADWNLVEDFTTSMELHAAGWTSVLHDRPLARGTAPATAAAAAKQRFQWAADAIRVLVWDSPLVRPGLSARARMHYAHAALAYLVAAAQVVVLAAPVLHLTGVAPALGRGSAAGFAMWGGLYAGAVAAWLLAAAGPRGALESVRSVAALAPTYAAAAVAAAWGRPLTVRVTEKARQSRLSWLIVPQLILGGALVVVAVAGVAYGAAVAAVWAAAGAFGLGGVLVSALRPGD